MITRYSRPPMVAIWAPENRFKIWLEIETLAAEAMAELGTIPKDVPKALRARAKFEVARIDYLARFRGGYPGLRADGIEALTIEANVRYLAPARFDDRLTVLARCGELRGARFRFDYSVERDGVAVADGWTRHACVDAVTHRPTRVPGWLADEISSAEG